MAYWDYNEILARMLIAAQDAEPECDTREGSLIYTACAPMAAELAQAYIAATLLLGNTFADVASREYLIRRAAERGVVPYPATKARYVCDWDYLSGAGPQPSDVFYSIDGVSYVVLTVATDQKTCVIECLQHGGVGNGKTGGLVPVVADNRFVSMTVKASLSIGEDDESTEHLRKRYFRELQSLAFGGSVTDYINFVNNIDGVGAVKIVPVWNGGGTVKVVIADSALQPATLDLVSKVQTELDPSVNSGQGLGLAPIGHTVTVVSAESTPINIEAYFVYLPGYAFSSLGDLLKTKIKNHIDELNSNWDSDNNIIVREATVVAEMLSTPGVVDVQNVKINGVNGNVNLGAGRLAAYGSLVDTGA